ncbi:MAG: hypothetical protein LBG50_04725, partial [Clostridiales Family XIII bacterium]|nr:hypothetical protein [Clostridiales Family XIII bacterium]
MATIKQNRKIRTFILLAAAALMALAFTACGNSPSGSGDTDQDSSSGGTELSGNVVIAGSTSVLPLS